MTSRTRPSATAATVPAVLAGLLLATTACSATTGDSGSDEGAGGADEKKVVVLTHDSFNLPKKLIADFEKSSGYTVEIKKSGDAGRLTNTVSLTPGKPVGDVVFGIDNTFASRAADSGALDGYDADLPASAEKLVLDGVGDRLTPIDTGNVCVNYDKAWFAKQGKPAPKNLDDLTKPAYKGLFVVPGADTSSPGMAFLLSTIAAKGEGWKTYWTDLMGNDVQLAKGWTEAYYSSFTGGGKGDRPIVVSYDSSPAFTVDEKTKKSTTAALLDTCFAQTEYAGVLAGAKNQEGAQKFVDFLLTKPVQSALPTSMYVFPVDSSVELPVDWKRFAAQPSDPASMDPAVIAKNRQPWLTAWSDLTTR